MRYTALRDLIGVGLGTIGIKTIGANGLYLSIGYGAATTTRAYTIGRGQIRKGYYKGVMELYYFGGGLRRGGQASYGGRIVILTYLGRLFREDYGGTLLAM